MIIVLLIGIVFIGKKFVFNNDVKSIPVVDKIKKTKLSIDDNVITLNYDELSKSDGAVKNLMNYEISIGNIIDKLINKDKDIKMYVEEDNRVLEATLNKNDADILFGNYVDVNDDIKIKIIFEETKDADEVKEIDLKINGEDILRNKVVETAVAQLEKTGEEFWEWYGYSSRVEWCCVFVSWVAAQHGLLDAGEVPKFVWVKKGVDYYKENNKWAYGKDYVPKPGDVIFYEWNGNDIIDHVGIVEKVEDGYVYAIEGNVSYMWVKRKKYKIDSKFIYGYGLPDYKKVASEM